MVRIKKGKAMRKLVMLALFDAGRTIADQITELELRPKVKFEDVELEVWNVSKDEEAQEYFNQGMVYLWAYDGVGALGLFQAAQLKDPKCAMCYWGETLALGPTINMPNLTQSQLVQGREAAHKASKHIKEANRGVEGDRAELYSKLIDASLIRFPSKIESAKERSEVDQNYAQALEKIYKHHMDSDTVAVLYAEAEMITSSFVYWNKSGKVPNLVGKKAIAAVEKVLKRTPHHPAALHLYIHLFESSDNLSKAEESGDILKKVAPWAPHLQHMPSHIYIQTGRYDDAVKANYIASHQAHQIYSLHNLDFLGFILRIQGRVGLALEITGVLQAKAMQARLKAPDKRVTERFSAQYMFTLVRFEQWQRIFWLQPPAKSLVYQSAVWHFARGMALAHTPEQSAKTDLAYLTEFTKHPDLRNGQYNELQVEELLKIMTLTLRAVVSQRSGDYDDSVELLNLAVDTEKKIRYDEPPQVSYSIRNYLGAVLMDKKDFSAARRVYEEELGILKDNGWSLKGLFLACNALHDRGCWKDASARFNKAWKEADVELVSSTAVQPKQDGNSMKCMSGDMGILLYFCGFLTGSILAIGIMRLSLYCRFQRAKGNRDVEFQQVPTS